MLFNSINYAIFLPIVFILYWFVANRSLKLQNMLLLVASYFFYAFWDWRFLLLLMFSTSLDYYTGLKMSYAENQNKKKFWFWLSVIINLGFLGIFKYYNFFAESFAGFISYFYPGPAATSTQWNVKVITKPGCQGDMPTSPKLGNVP